MKPGHRIVDVLRLGLFWMVLWAAIGAILSIVVGIVDPPSIDPGEGPVDMARILGGVGAACGVVFGLLLVVGERHRMIADVPLLRAVLWGAIAGIVLPLLPSVNDSVVLNTGPLGAVSAAGSVALARLARRFAAVAKGGGLRSSGRRCPEVGPDRQTASKSAAVLSDMMSDTSREADRSPVGRVYPIERGGTATSGVEVERRGERGLEAQWQSARRSGGDDPGPV